MMLEGVQPREDSKELAGTNFKHWPESLRANCIILLFCDFCFGCHGF